MVLVLFIWYWSYSYVHRVIGLGLAMATRNCETTLRKKSITSLSIERSISNVRTLYASDDFETSVNILPEYWYPRCKVCARLSS